MSSNFYYFISDFSMVWLKNFEADKNYCRVKVMHQHTATSV